MAIFAHPLGQTNQQDGLAAMGMTLPMDWPFVSMDNLSMPPTGNAGVNTGPGPNGNQAQAQLQSDNLMAGAPGEMGM